MPCKFFFKWRTVLSSYHIILWIEFCLKFLSLFAWPIIRSLNNGLLSLLKDGQRKEELAKSVLLDWKSSKIKTGTRKHRLAWSPVHIPLLKLLARRTLTERPRPFENSDYFTMEIHLGPQKITIVCCSQVTSTILFLYSFIHVLWIGPDEPIQFFIENFSKYYSN